MDTYSAPDSKPCNVSDNGCFSNDHSMSPVTNTVSIADILSLAQSILENQEVINCTNEEAKEYEESDKFKRPTKVIKEWVLTREETLVLKEGLTFDDLKQCENFQKIYAYEVGFSVRKSSCKKGKGVEKFKNFVCSNQGFKDTFRSDKCKEKEKVRKRKLIREGSNVLVGFKRTEDDKYILYKFYEGNTHLLATPTKRHMLTSNSRVKSVHRTLFKSFFRANISLSKAHRFMKEQVGGFEMLDALKKHLKIFNGLESLYKGFDAHMFVENLKRKKELNKSLYFAYELDDDQWLKHVFLSDGISRRNYTLYEDVVSFDTTFDTNRYKMTFVPFTGLDNHRLCVTFGAAFLGDEKAKSFKWLFEKFLEAIAGHKSVCVITDQDPAMKIAI